MVNRFITKNL